MQQNLVPPWLKYPEIPRYSIGWRMGYGEGYLIQWWGWSLSWTQEQRLAYFRQYLPIPLEWLDWVAAQFGHDDLEEMIEGKSKFKGIQWLEQQELGNFAEWKKWYDENWKSDE